MRQRHSDRHLPCRNDSHSSTRHHFRRLLAASTAESQSSPAPCGRAGRRGFRRKRDGWTWLHDWRRCPGLRFLSDHHTQIFPLIHMSIRKKEVSFEPMHLLGPIKVLICSDISVGSQNRVRQRGSRIRPREVTQVLILKNAKICCRLSRIVGQTRTFGVTSSFEIAWK